jgi:hypothetical protein
MIPRDTKPGTRVSVKLHDGSKLVAVTRDPPKSVAGRWIVVVQDGRGFALERCTCEGCDARPA